MSRTPLRRSMGPNAVWHVIAALRLNEADARAGLYGTATMHQARTFSWLWARVAPDHAHLLENFAHAFRHEWAREAAQLSRALPGPRPEHEYPIPRWADGAGVIA